LTWLFSGGRRVGIENGEGEKLEGEKEIKKMESMMGNENRVHKQGDLMNRCIMNDFIKN